MWILDEDAPTPSWRPRSAPAGVALGFSTRRGGVSRPPFDTLNLGRSTEDDPAAVAENRRRFVAALGLDPESVAAAGQVHGESVARVEGPGLHPGCDALLTRTPGVALAITAADCLPLLLVAGGAVGAVHSGWRGTAAGAPRAALAELAGWLSVSPASVTVHVGPSIRSCCYVVGDEVASRFPAAAVLHGPAGKRLDLVAAARIQLEEAGVRPERIHVVDACTACDPLRYFSHRRDGPRTGRHWAVAALRT